MPSQSEVLGLERAERRQRQRQAEARAEAARRQALDDPKRRSRRSPRIASSASGRRSRASACCGAIDDYRRTVPEFVYEAPVMFRLLPGRR